VVAAPVRGVGASVATDGGVGDAPDRSNGRPRPPEVDGRPQRSSGGPTATYSERQTTEEAPVPAPLRIVICDDDPAFRSLVQRVLRDHVEVVGTAGSCDEALEVTAATQPDALLLDVLLGTDTVIGVLPQLLVAAPRTMVAALTGLDAEDWEDDVLVAGAFVFYEKTSALHLPRLLEDDLALFRRALEGEDVLAPSALGRRGADAVTLRAPDVPGDATGRGSSGEPGAATAAG
jgi:CheY-like chemotaxis protein